MNFVERQVLLCGHTVERVFHDYGYDLFLFTFDANGEPEAGEIRVQVKATDILAINSEKETISLRVACADLIYWLSERLPVVLVLYDATREVAYWIDIRNYCFGLPGFNVFSIGKTLTIHIPCSNIFDQTAIAELTIAKNRERGSN